MKIKNTNRTIDLSALLTEYKKKYRNIFMFQFEEQVFIYHSIGRKDYKEIVLNEELDAQEKEERLCKLCVIWPASYDFENCEEAGIPTRLAEEIINNSYISKESRDKVLAYFRNEMFDVDNQINGIILSAFPTLNLEEVENWDVVTAAKYLSRAEWMLHNINGIPLREPDTETSFVGDSQKESYVNTPTTTEITDEDIENSDVIKSTAASKKIAHSGKAKLTPQKLAELKAKFPMIDWEHDDVAMHGIEGITNQPNVDTTPVALRTPSRR